MAVLLMVCIFLLFSSACSLIPQETEHTGKPGAAADDVEYEFAYVLCGRLEKTASVVCAYYSAESEDLSFNVDGEGYSGIYVRPGDSVSAGDLVAERDTAELKQKLADTRRLITELENRISYLNEEMELKVRKQELLIALAAPEEKLTLDSPEMVRYEYTARISSDSCSLEEQRALAERLEQEIEDGRLYAGMDGTVTFVREISPLSVTTANSKVVTIADTEKSFFKATTRYKDSFHVGDIGVVKVDRDEYEVTVVNPADYGAETAENEVWFAPTAGGFGLSQGDKGTLDVVLESIEDTLYVNKNAVSVIGDSTVVFYLDDNNLRKFREVTVGETVGDYIQILDGVQEGELLIVG